MDFALYLDESGKTHPHVDYTSLCGYLSTCDEWARFSDSWDGLRIKWDIPPMHMGRIMLDRTKGPDSKNDGWTQKYEEMKDIWESWRDQMLEEFASLVFQSNVACVGAVVDSKAFQRVKLDPECYLDGQDSNVFALQIALTLALTRILRIDQNPSVQLVIDDDEQNAFHYYGKLRDLRSMPGYKRLPDRMLPRFEQMRKYIHGISFYNDKFHPPLQAADMIAYIARDFKVRRKASIAKPESGDLYGLLTHSHLNQPKWYSEQMLFRIAKSTKQKIEAVKNEENCNGI